jgi:RNA polymerase sigma-70 factor (ECF subfamily)
MHSQSLDKVRSFINRLPETLRTAFTLRENDGMSYEEISLITNTPIGTVRSRIFRAREGVLEFISQESTNEK